MVHGQAGKLQRAGTGGDDHPVAFDGDGTFVRGDVHEPRVDDAAPAPDEPYAEAGAGFFKAAAQGGADFFLAGEHGGGIGGRRPLPDDAELGQAQGDFQRLGGRLQRLGGDAAVVQTGSAEAVAFHESDEHSGAGGGEGRRVPAGASADDGQTYGHGSAPSLRRIRGSGCISPGRPLRATP